MVPDNRLIALNFLAATSPRHVSGATAIASLLVHAHTTTAGREKKMFPWGPRNTTMGHVTCVTFEKCLHNEINDLHFLTTLATIKKGSEVFFLLISNENISNKRHTSHYRAQWSINYRHNMAKSTVNYQGNSSWPVCARRRQQKEEVQACCMLHLINLFIAQERKEMQICTITHFSRVWCNLHP